jgi:hypothetical protein
MWISASRTEMARQTPVNNMWINLSIKTRDYPHVLNHIMKEALDHDISRGFESLQRGDSLSSAVPDHVQGFG